MKQSDMGDRGTERMTKIRENKTGVYGNASSFGMLK